MEFKKRILFFVILSLFALSLVPLVPTRALAAHSFSQQKGDEFIWEVTVTDGRPIMLGGGSTTVGDRLNITIFDVIQYIWGGFSPTDTLRGQYYQNSASNRTWTQIFGGAHWDIETYIHKIGLFYKEIHFLIPHNETAVSSAWYQVYGPYFEQYNWTSGLHGYDGKVEAWNGSAAGEPGKQKLEVKYNKDGVLQHYRWYIGGSSIWILFYSLDLLPTIPELESITGPNTDGIIELDWDDSIAAETYYIYRNGTPINAVTESNYTDLVTASGVYCYTIVAGNAVGNSSPSNSECVLVLPAPELGSITSPNTDGIIDINWNEMTGATMYYVFRNNTYIKAVTDSNYTDTVDINGTYFYTVIAGYAAGNSSHSNPACVVVAIPPTEDGIPGFNLLLCLIPIILLGTVVVFSEYRKKIRI